MKYYLTALLTLCSSTLFANMPNASLYGIEIGESISTAKTKLQSVCQNTVSDITLNTPSFPLASKREQHLSCNQLKNKGKIAVVIADNQVAHISASNIAPDAVIGLQNDPKQYLGFKAHHQHTLWQNNAKNQTTLIGKDALHPNLFVWSHPEIKALERSKPALTLANLLQFGESLDTLKPLFEAHCDPLKIETSAPWLFNNPKEQVQVNCFNFPAFGFPRKIEAVFGDNHLELAWILTAKPEQTRISKQLTAHFGDSVFDNETWQAFKQGEVYLRKDKPEVLAISKALVPLFKEKAGIEF